MEKIINDHLKTEEEKFTARKEELERQYKEKEYLLYGRDELIKHGLHPDLLSQLKATDKESLDKSIVIINNLFQKQVQFAVLKRMAGETPRGTSGQSASSLDIQLKKHGKAIILKNRRNYNGNY
jgi:hypothetical protein